VPGAMRLVGPRTARRRLVEPNILCSYSFTAGPEVMYEGSSPDTTFFLSWHTATGSVYSFFWDHGGVPNTLDGPNPGTVTRAAGYYNQFRMFFTYPAGGSTVYTLTGYIAPDGGLALCADRRREEWIKHTAHVLG
jgi:hypothetical protein